MTTPIARLREAANGHIHISSYSEIALVLIRQSDLRAILELDDALVEALEKIGGGMDAYRITHGSPGPLYNAGWNAGVEFFGNIAKAALSRLTQQEPPRGR